MRLYQGPQENAGGFANICAYICGNFIQDMQAFFEKKDNMQVNMQVVFQLFAEVLLTFVHNWTFVCKTSY